MSVAYPAASETLNPYSLPIILLISKIMPSYMWVNNSGGGIQFICHHSHHTLGGRNRLYSLDLNAVLCSSGPEAMSLSIWSLSILMAAHAVSSWQSSQVLNLADNTCLGFYWHYTPTFLPKDILQFPPSKDIDQNFPEMLTQCQQLPTFRFPIM